MNKIAFYDFCHTLVNFQTADKFVDFVREQENIGRARNLESIRKFAVKSKFFAIHNKLFPQKNWHKKLKLFQLKGLHVDLLNKYAREYCKKILMPQTVEPVVKCLLKDKKEGYEIAIVSGGYDIYIKHFAENFNIEHVVASKIKFNITGYCDGTIDGMDCLFEHKVKAVKNYLNLSKYNLTKSKVYSDSMTDMPLFNLVGRKIAVSSSSKQSWVNELFEREIIY